MDSFSTPDVRNSDGIAPSPANFIAPGKRPMSSQSLTLVLNSDGTVRMVIGASGSSRMITSISMVKIVSFLFWVAVFNLKWRQNKTLLTSFMKCTTIKISVRNLSDNIVEYSLRLDFKVSN